VTSATYIEAGAELSFEDTVAFYPSNVKCSKISNDQMRIEFDFGEIPKQGTGLTLALPSTNLLFRDGAANSSAVIAAHTLASIIFIGTKVRTTLTQVGAFSSLNVGSIGFRVNGTGCKLTIDS
jgi:hypothetical protein